jgi:hypothetical protein
MKLINKCIFTTILNIKRMSKSKIVDAEITILNEEVKRQYCSETENAISDESLLSIYKETDSVKRQSKLLKEILKEEGIETEKIDRVLTKYILSLIPPGTKGVIRGNKFNKLVEKKIKSFELNSDKDSDFEIKCEKSHPDFETSEIPDWYIYQKSTKKIIIGMNQLDLWSGGAQSNRGAKYVLDDSKHKTENVKFLSVICKDKVIASKNNKMFKIFQVGFGDKRLCYIKGIEEIVKDFFKL